MRTAPFPARGHIGAEEKAAVDVLFDRAMATGEAPGYNGEAEDAYCEAFSTYMGGGYTDAVSSGTAGLYVALRALDLEPFGEVIVGAVTDPGGMMPIPLLNLIPIIADTTPGSYNTGLDQVAACLSPHTRAVVIPHIGGEPADIAPIVEAAHARGIPVIEDGSQSHGATIDGRRVVPLATSRSSRRCLGNTTARAGRADWSSRAMPPVIRRSGGRPIAASPSSCPRGRPT